ncbi:cell division protein MraZ [Candidatus Mycoplasma haematolamae str. Purdue]|uniref:Cell division protein MraZ n=1 Tax=Mycoplasma haematolamae (strain Purdue) TaxID=1212765 RepID=I7BIY5_MYCHA|nr:cell division protein MraZ [Candidatus Mycoplasma haematolamae]AFO51788.1 cell division protein MraZ [Candidatus Mycoplasma haematolamae str. Purdue]
MALKGETKNIVYRYFFSGTYFEKIDKKKRVSIPVQWQHILKDKAIITKNQDGSHALWTTDFFQYFSKVKIEQCETEEDRQITKRLFIGGARTIDIDSKHRMLIPEDLVTLFQHDNLMYFVGVGDYIEIWTKELFESWKESKMPKDIPAEDTSI